LKKKTGIYNEIFSRKWRLIFITLVLIFSVISLSATGAENRTNSQARDKVVHESNIGVSNETGKNNCSYCIESDEKNDTGKEYSYFMGSNEEDENEDGYSYIIVDENHKDKCSYCTEDEENFEQKVGENKSKENQKTVENSTKSKTETENNTKTQETIENSTKSKTETENNTKSKIETVENNTKSKTETENNTKSKTETVENNTKSKTETENNTKSKIETVENSTKSKTETENNTENQGIVEDIEQETDLADSILHYKVYKVENSQEKIKENESKSSESNVSDWYKKIAVNKTIAQENESNSNDTDSKENIEENDSKSSGINVTDWYKKIAVNKTVAQENESDSNNTDSKENIEGDDSKSSKSDGSNCKCKIITVNKTAIQENKSDSSESNVSNLKYKTTTVNRTVTQNNTKTKNETKTETVNESKSLKSTEVETENKTKISNGNSNGTSDGNSNGNLSGNSNGNSNGNLSGNSNGNSNSTKSVESEVVSPEVNWTNNLRSQKVNEIKVYNWTDSQGNKSVTSEVKTEKNSWNNIKYILSYSYPLRSFYTTNDNVNISYNGPETLRYQSVDIFLIKERSPSSPENEISYGMNESTISLEDVLNNDTEAYVKIPATLNKEGDLDPLRLDPLQAGHYWILITPAGNETEKTVSEKEVLLAKYFEVLKYQIEARSPSAIQKGENLEVNLDLENEPAEKNYTYWAVLIKDGAYTAFEGTNPRWRMTTGIRPIVNGVDLIKRLETNLSRYESDNEKDELKNEIQTLIGKDNGTISIGEKNQSKLSLKSLDLPPGDYILLTGAYEDNKGLIGTTQKKMRISPEDLYGLGLTPSSENTLGDESSTKFETSPLMEIKSILENPKSFIFEDVKPYIQANSLAEVLRNPPKLPSFLLGFAVTLLIGFAVLRKKK